MFIEATEKISAPLSLRPLHSQFCLTEKITLTMENVKQRMSHLGVYWIAKKYTNQKSIPSAARLL